MRLIDADALKDKLQQHHDFYVMAWGGFGNMPIGDKRRVDEITNCIAEVVNAPTIDAIPIEHINLMNLVEVVRCKECKHWEMRNSPRGWCIVHQGYVSPQYFCADGEREGE